MRDLTVPLILTALVLSFWGVVIWVAIHFITKFW